MKELKEKYNNFIIAFIEFKTELNKVRYSPEDVELITYYSNLIKRVGK